MVDWDPPYPTWKTEPVDEPITREDRRRAERVGLAHGIAVARARNVLGTDITPEQLVAYGLEYADRLLAAVDGKTEGE